MSEIENIKFVVREEVKNYLVKDKFFSTRDTNLWRNEEGKICYKGNKGNERDDITDPGDDVIT